MAVTIKYPYGQSATIGGVRMLLVNSLPTASASTMGDIYLVPRSGSDIKDMYITTVSGNSYSWTPIGSTELDLDGLIVDDLVTGGTDKALSAEQGKIIGEELYGSGRTLVDLTQLTDYGVYVATATNKWAEGATTGAVFIPVTPGEKYQLVASKTKDSGYFVAQDNSHTTGTTPSYATGYNNVVSISAGTSTDEITIPNDGHYIMLYTKISSASTLASVYKISEETVTPGLVERVDNMDVQLKDVYDEVFGKGRHEVDLSNKTKNHIYIASANNKWASSDAVDMVFVPVTPGDVYEIIASVADVPYALLQTDSHVIGTTPYFCVGYESPFSVYAGESINITIPQDGHYIAIWTKLSSGATSPELFRITDTPSDGLKDKVAELENYVEKLNFDPAGVKNNRIDYVESIQSTSRVVTLVEQELIPSVGAHLTSYGGKLYFTVDGVKYAVSMTPAPYYNDND